MRYYLLALCLLASAESLRAGEGTFDSNGVKIFYRDEGAPDGIPVVLVHGYLAENRVQWDSDLMMGPQVLKALRDTTKYRIILVDSRGHGKSDKPLGDNKYGVEMAEDVKRLMEHLKIKQAHVVGYSLGSWVAQKFAADNPGMVRSLTVAGAGLYNPTSAAGFHVLAKLLEVYGGAGPQADAAGESLAAAFKGRVKVPAKGDVPALLLVAKGADGLQLDNAKAVSYPGPVLGLAGTDDTEMKPTVEALAAARVAAKREMQVKIVPGDHLVAPAAKEFAEELVKFLGKH